MVAGFAKKTRFPVASAKVSWFRVCSASASGKLKAACRLCDKQLTNNRSAISVLHGYLETHRKLLVIALGKQEIIEKFT